jgi:hypothetical protein
MRLTLVIILTLFSLTTQAQKYSAVVKDTVILNFMKWLLNVDTSLVKNHKKKILVDNDIIKLPAAIFKYADTSQVNSDLDNIFNNTNRLGKILDENDANYFIHQIDNIKTAKWNFRIKNIVLHDEIELYNTTFYSYSLPIFSVDNLKVIIVQAFWCGVVCGGGGYFLYEKQNDNSWKKIREFNIWAE